MIPWGYATISCEYRDFPGPVPEPEAGRVPGGKKVRAVFYK